jgi:hypothetical protein
MLYEYYMMLIHCYVKSYKFYLNNVINIKKRCYAKYIQGKGENNK